MNEDDDCVVHIDLGKIWYSVDCFLLLQEIEGIIYDTMDMSVQEDSEESSKEQLKESDTVMMKKQK